MLPGICVRAATYKVVADTHDQIINAIQATMDLPTGSDVQSISTGDSVVTIWVKQPTIESGKVDFAGITPGGFNGKATLFSIESDKGIVDVRFQNITALLNDGSGTPARVTLSIENSDKASAEDIVPPEIFKPLLGRDPSLESGRYFLAFSTTDKQTGINHYEAAETWLTSPSNNDWATTSSPYVVKDATLLKKVYVRAIDNAGNLRVEEVILPYRVPVEILLAIILIALCIFYIRRRRVS